MMLRPTSSIKMETITVAAGCFWGVEHIYRKNFQNCGVGSFIVGYTGGSLDKPSYKQVCSDSTGHAEALQMTFNPKQVSYEELVKFFFRIHDPTTLNRQGPDVGKSYRSAIFYHNDSQRVVAERVRDHAQRHMFASPIATEITPAGKFWPAEDYHQAYLDRNPHGYECPTHFLRKWID